MAVDNRSYSILGKDVETKKGATPFWIWSSLQEGKDLLFKGVRWNIANGMFQKLKHFVWKAPPNWIASRRTCIEKSVLKNRLCKCEVESVKHLLFKCGWAEKVLSRCGLNHVIGSSNTISVARWSEDV